MEIWKEKKMQIVIFLKNLKILEMRKIEKIHKEDLLDIKNHMKIDVVLDLEVLL